ncbi:5-amino-6-(5-phospho-D-ribitylamino)uracil phosphatase YigB [Enterobacteriaceae bacterium LUAb1]
MKFYRPLREIQALTFDLDDTLYDNREVIRKTISETHAFLQHYHPALKTFSEEDYQQLRHDLARQHPEIQHDVTEWRRLTVACAMRNAGLSDTEAEQGSHDVMAFFASWRSKISVSQENHAVLSTLARRWPLAVITNGNAQPQQFGIAHYFQFILRAGPDGRAKPYEDMFQLAAQRLGIQPDTILHVGDDLTTDVAGALRSGMQSCWMRLYQENLAPARGSGPLPHIEITQLASLTTLI